LPVDELAVRVVPYLQAAGLVADPPTPQELATVVAAAPLIHERMTTLGEAATMVGFIFVPEDVFTVDPDDDAKLLNAEGVEVVRASYEALSALTSWDTATIEAALRAKLIDELQLKPRQAFGPVRVAITGRRISPPLFESLELLGRDRSLLRIRAVAGRA